MVQTIGVAKTIHVLLLFNYSCRCFRWASRYCYWKDGRYTGLSRMAMGVHPGYDSVPFLSLSTLIPCKEGILTCVVGLLFFFAIPDFPEEVSWLSPEERQFVKARLQEDVGESQRHKSLKPKEVFSILRECKLHCGGSKATCP